jgi:PhzF family phenazine biosynthesis protein
MRAPIFQVDAFTSQRFSGNPAAVVLVSEFPPDHTMQAISAENNLAETAFLVRAGDAYDIRWFTPTLEVPFCGHATLASAAVVMERLQPGTHRTTFQSASGPLIAARIDGGYVIDVPARPTQAAAAPPGMREALGADPVEVLTDPYNWVVRLEDANAVRQLNPDLGAIERLGRAGLIVTAAGDGAYDLVSRYFAPAKGIPEDPVTGGAHCTLAPLWSSRLAKTSLHAYQASPRGGELRCRVRDDRVELTGACVFYLEGHIEF